MTIPKYVHSTSWLGQWMVSCVFDLLFDLGWRMWLSKPLGDNLTVHYLENIVVNPQSDVWG